MLAAEIASVTVKPSMILARKRRVGNLMSRAPLRPAISTPVFILKTQRNPAACAPDPARKPKAEWIGPGKFRGWLPANGAREAVRLRVVIPGASAPGPEFRDSGFGASHRPGMTNPLAAGVAFAASNDRAGQKSQLQVPARL